MVEPLGLVLKAGAWYLVARSDGVARIYKVANILQYEVRDTHFERPPDFDLAAWWSAETARFEAGLRTGTAQLRATATGLKRLSQLGAFAQRAVKTAGPVDGDGWSCLSLPIETIDHAALTLLGIGPEVVVLAPDALRFRLRDLAAEVVHRSTMSAATFVEAARQRQRAPYTHRTAVSTRRASFQAGCCCWCRWATWACCSRSRIWAICAARCRAGGGHGR